MHPHILRQFGYEDLLLQFCAVNPGPTADLILPTLKPSDLVPHTYESFANELAQERNNLVTLDAKPTDPFPPRCLTYVTDFLYAADVSPPDPAFLLGCSCTNEDPAAPACGTPNSGCSCAERVTHDQPTSTYKPGPKSRAKGRKRPPAALHSGHYNEERRLIAAKRGDRRTVGVAECAAQCMCPPQCTNRVVQHGVQVRMVVRYDKYKGWAAIADQDVIAGTFVAQYLGEVVTVDEAHARTLTYNRLGYSTYLYDMDFWANEMEDMGLPGIKFAIDAQFKGNVARFFNHSCDANLLAAAVLYDAAEPHHHRLAFFARRDIKRGEELCFDYQGGREETGDDAGSLPEFERLRFECHCGSANCRKVIF
ncbi:hypothetical protein BCR44DRAFT_1459024 [Catenaria anguillulae PL171]|uniref:SET domain-containing protein n=1 Tax=Catenaria anguillulae PL171 TaxID=765915 RepID=A0A1Y2HVL8_9FUNG|nr:hypothetical protein BCR44DRAFT_1459024 [Catenaria anguillulae PL171]